MRHLARTARQVISIVTLYVINDTRYYMGRDQELRRRQDAKGVGDREVAGSAGQSFDQKVCRVELGNDVR